ncbi:Pkinase-domain-containing protein [Panus rudis PR-1116 ss-1]|nr:Pkinase-domain-containing protein [Panus rudis PR-1116 ss-1]
MTRTKPNAMMTALLGHRIDGGRLKLIRILGSGSSGVVFLAIEIQGGRAYPERSYAVKCMDKVEPDSVAYIMKKREIDHHRRVSLHPNIVNLHHVIDEGSFTSLVLDYCPGGDLFKLISEDKVFAGKDEYVKSIFLQLLDAVDFCHRNGIYHRDIKPENVLCNSDRTFVYLADFGLSTQSAYSSNFTVGSYSYMSPECLHCDIQTPYYSSKRNDVWSLGIILTSMISGRNPWRLARRSDECYKAFLQDPNFLRTMLPISEGANNILTKIFTFQERDRISLSTLRRMIVELDSFFMSPEEIARSNAQVRNVANSYFPSSYITPIPPLENSSLYGEILDADDNRRCFHLQSAHGETRWVDQPSIESRYSDPVEVHFVPPANPTTVHPTNGEDVSSAESHGPPTPLGSVHDPPAPILSSALRSHYPRVGKDSNVLSVSPVGFFRRIIERIRE